MSHLHTRISSASVWPGKQLLSLLVGFTAQLVQGFSLDALRSMEIFYDTQKKKKKVVCIFHTCLSARSCGWGEAVEPTEWPWGGRWLWQAGRDAPPLGFVPSTVLTCTVISVRQDLEVCESQLEIILTFFFFFFCCLFLVSLRGPDVRACTLRCQACRHSSADTPWHRKHALLIKRGVLIEGEGGRGGRSPHSHTDGTFPRNTNVYTHAVLRHLEDTLALMNLKCLDRMT